MAQSDREHRASSRGAVATPWSRGVRVRGEDTGHPTSLRAEFLFNLAFLAAAAVLLALWLAWALQRSGVSIGVLVILVGAAVLAFVLVGNYLVERWVLRPLAAIAWSAEAIAAGEYDHRVSEKGPKEIASLARALNQLTNQLLHNQDRLAENVRSLDETNQRLTEAHSELVQVEKMASLGHLAAGVAHEIGNPLGAVLGYISLQKRRGGEPELVEGLEREARRIDRIVRGLLEYARPASALPDELDVNRSVCRVVEFLREQGWLADVYVELDLGADLPRIVADSHRVDQVFVNLLQNAESAMDGRGRIRVVTRLTRYKPDKPIAIRRADDPPGVNYAHLRRARIKSGRSAGALEPDRNAIQIVVADTGPGIPDKILNSVFDPFFTTKGPGEGTGLGLAIVAGTVAELGGRIEASSPAEGGAVFNLWLPTTSRE